MRRNHPDRERHVVWVLAVLANLLVVAGVTVAGEPTTRRRKPVQPVEAARECPVGDMDAAVLLADLETLECERIWTPHFPFFPVGDTATIDLGIVQVSFGYATEEKAPGQAKPVQPSAAQPAITASFSGLPGEVFAEDAAPLTPPHVEVGALATCASEGSPLRHTPSEAVTDILELRRRLGSPVQGTAFAECGTAEHNQEMMRTLAEHIRQYEATEAAPPLPRRICQPTVHAAGFPIAQLPEHAVWAMPPATMVNMPMPAPFTAEQGEAAMLRDVAEQIEAAANQLERTDRYERADQLRQMAAQVRADARTLKTTAPQPSHCDHCGANCKCGPGKHCGAEGCAAVTSLTQIAPERPLVKFHAECTKRGPCGGEAGSWIVVSEPRPQILPPRIVQPPMDALIEAFSVEKAVEKAAESQAEYAELVRELQALSGDLKDQLNRPTLPLTEPEASHLRQTVRRLRQHVRELK